MSDSTEYQTCDRCERDTPLDDITKIELEETWSVCGGCLVALDEEVEFFDQRERWTKKQHERAVNILDEIDEVECVIHDFEDNLIIVHTAYATSDVVVDLCEHFGLVITSFHPVWEMESEWKCIDNHGSIYQITLEYRNFSPEPKPTHFKYLPRHIENVEPNDKQF